MAPLAQFPRAFSPQVLVLIPHKKPIILFPLNFYLRASLPFHLSPFHPPTILPSLSFITSHYKNVLFLSQEKESPYLASINLLNRKNCQEVVTGAMGVPDH